MGLLWRMELAFSHSLVMWLNGENTLEKQKQYFVVLFTVLGERKNIFELFYVDLLIFSLKKILYKGKENRNLLMSAAFNCFIADRD